MTVPLIDKLGVVVIGRNEGDRLLVCLKSLTAITLNVVYVDSGSTDDSVFAAKNMGVHIHHLDMSTPFSAARARNEGFESLLNAFKSTEFVQFVDGDCQIDSQWLPLALEYLSNHDNVAIVCGRRRERFPDKSIYNKHCDIEWNTPIGEAKASGGDFLVKTAAFNSVKGFNASLIAGEEPELCIRIRRSGWKIWRLDADMTFHDANILKFGQFWKRCVRSGYAFAKGVEMHGDHPEHHWVKETRRGLLWGGCLPLLWLILIIYNSNLAWLIPIVYLLQWFRLVASCKKYHDFAYWQANLLLIGKFAEFQGIMQFIKDLITENNSTIIEYH